MRIGTLFNVTDNSGVLSVLSIQNLSNSSKILTLGNVIVGVIKKLSPKVSAKYINLIVWGVIIRSKVGFHDKAANFVNFNDNSIVLIDKNLNPLGSRIFGSIPKKLKTKNFLKLSSLTLDLI